MSQEKSLSTDTDGLSAKSADQPDSTSPMAMERVADPNDYNLRRRLKQLHDAKEAVKRRKDNTLELQRLNRDFPAQQRDRLVAEKLVDYIHELRPLLRKTEREKDFLAEEVDGSNGESVTIQSIMESRGYVSGNYISYSVSMAAWDICNSYFEDVAGVVFERNSPDPSNNLVDPAGRFNE